MQLRNAGGLSPLVQLLKSINAEVRRNASWAISVCANDEITTLELLMPGVSMFYAFNTLHFIH